MRITSYALAASTLALDSGCSGGAEQKILDDFFRASRLRDNTTLGNFATVSFDPRTDGVVQSFDVVSVSEERARPLPLKQYAKQLADAKAAEEAFSAQKRAYQNANIAAIDRVTKAQAAESGCAQGQGRGRRLGEVDQRRRHAQEGRVGRATPAQRQQRHRRAQHGAGPPSASEVTSLEGEVASKDVVINATVRQPDGATTTKPLKAVVPRATMKDASGQGRRRPLDRHRPWTCLSGP